MKDGLVLQKRFELWPRADLGSVVEGAAASKDKKWINRGLVEKVTHFLSSEMWDTTTSGVLGSKTPKGALLPASLAQCKAISAFLQDTKQCPGGCPAAAGLHHSLTCHEVFTAPAHSCSCCANPQAQSFQSHLRSPLKTGTRAKLPTCLLMSCSSGGLSEISVGKELTKLRAVAL